MYFNFKFYVNNFVWLVMKEFLILKEEKKKKMKDFYFLIGEKINF